MKTMLISFITLFNLMLFSNIVKAQNNQSNLKTLSAEFLQDISNGKTNACVSYGLLMRYYKKAVVPTLDEEISDDQIISAAITGLDQQRNKYKENIKKINEFLKEQSFDLSELTSYSVLPLRKTNHPIDDQKFLSVETVALLLGDSKKRLSILATVLAENEKIKILELDVPDTYIDFENSDYVYIYNSMYKILDLIVNPIAIARGGSLFQNKIDKEWYKCSVQFIGDNSITKIKTNVIEENPDALLSMPKSVDEIYVKLFDQVKFNTGLVSMVEFLSILSQGYHIKKNKVNNLSHDDYITAYASPVLQENKETGEILGNLSFIKKSNQSELCKLKMILKKNDNGKASLELYIYHKQD
jgi:hypothetical protein